MNQDLTYLSPPAHLYPWVPWLALVLGAVLAAGIATSLITRDIVWVQLATVVSVCASFAGIFIMLATYPA